MSTTPHDHSHDEEHHAHEMVAVADGSPVPTVAIEAIADSKDGYNLAIRTENFTFSPADVGGESVANEGHAHLYVNSTKVARVYSNWYHLEADALQAGENTVRVTLNTNDHGEWAVDGEAVADAITVTR